MKTFSVYNVHQQSNKKKRMTTIIVDLAGHNLTYDLVLMNHPTNCNFLNYILIPRLQIYVIYIFLNNEKSFEIPKDIDLYTLLVVILAIYIWTSTNFELVLLQYI